jgi:fructosamine-3-kinase
MHIVPKITFTNEPLLSEHGVDRKFNERRISLLPLVKDFITNHPRFIDKEVSVSFAHKGVSSLISIIDTAEEKLILKIPLSMSNNGSEALFLREWEKAGVKVPHVFEEGRLGESSYILMEFINAPLLSSAYSSQELLEKTIYFQMGEMLYQMHIPEARGYGKVNNRAGEFNDFEQWIRSADMEKRALYINENALWNEDIYGSLSQATEILIDHVKKENKSTYCHEDFNLSNLFATQPITVFDPSPRFNNRYLDIGRTLLSFLEKPICSEQFLSGYFKEEELNRKVLHASVMINIFIKLPYSHQTKNQTRIDKYYEYLSKNKHLLV